jgi:hypothetical protein
MGGVYMVFEKHITSVLNIRLPKREEDNKSWNCIARRKQDNSYQYAYRVPSGYSVLDVEKHIDALRAGVGHIVEIEDRAGVVIISVLLTDLPQLITYETNMLDLLYPVRKDLTCTSEKALGKVLYGYDREGSPVYSNDINPHLLLAGASGYGKTDALRLYMLEWLHQYPDSKIVISDFKGCSFLPFEKIGIKVVEDIEDTYYLLDEAYIEMRRRVKQIKQAGTRKIAKSFNWWIIVIDECAEMTPTPSMKKGKKVEGIYIPAERDYAEWSQSRLSSLVRIGREMKIAVWLCTQYPTKEAIHNQIKANLINVVSLKLEHEIDSLTVMNSPLAYQLPEGVAGRAVVKGKCQIQIPYVGNDDDWDTVLSPYRKEIRYDEETENYTNDVYDTDCLHRSSREILQWKQFPSETRFGKSSRIRKSEVD